MSEFRDYQTASGLTVVQRNGNGDAFVHQGHDIFILESCSVKDRHPLAVPLPSIHAQPEGTNQMKQEPRQAEDFFIPIKIYTRLGCF